jgi:hypothetical protein|tara:strand:+ start:1102 stop:1515 length:414 start_codon:yes stop_codon:yes gene_type:complete
MAIEKILYPAQRSATLPKLKNGGNVVPIPPNPGAPDWHDEDYYKKRVASPARSKNKKNSSNGDWHEAPWYDYPEDQPYEPGKRNGLPGIIRLAMNESELRRFYGGWLVPHGFSENEILNMPMDELEEIFNAIMGSRA